MAKRQKQRSVALGAGVPTVLGGAFLLCACSPVTPPYSRILRECPGVDVPDFLGDKPDFREFMARNDVVLVGEVRELPPDFEGKWRKDGFDGFDGKITRVFEITPHKFYKRPADLQSGPFEAFLTFGSYGGEVQLGGPHVSPNTVSFLVLDRSKNSKAVYEPIFGKVCEQLPPKTGYLP